MEAMPNKKHHVRRNADERIQLETILRKGKARAHRQGGSPGPRAHPAFG